MEVSIAFAEIKIESAFKSNDFTYNFFKDVDLVEEHTLLVIVHVTLTEYFDGTLGARFSVYAHTDLSKSTYYKIQVDVRKLPRLKICQ